MARTPQDVTDAELSVLHALWERGAATVRELTDELYPGGATSEYATVQKLLDRLSTKGYTERNRDTWPHQFQPTVGRDELIGRRLQSTADQLCEGSLQPLISHLVRSQKLTEEDRSSLRGLLDELEQETKKGKSRGRKKN